MRTTEKLLEEPKKDLDLPPLRVNQSDDFRWNIKQIGRDPQDAVTAGSSGGSFVFRSSCLV